MQSNHYVPVPLAGTSKLLTNEVPKAELQGRTAKPLPELLVLNQNKPARYTSYQMEPNSTPSNSNNSRHNIFKSKSESSSMSTPSRCSFTKKPEDLPFSQSRIQNMTSADAEAANLLLIFSHSNMKQPQITPEHKAMPALIPIVPGPEITCPFTIKQEDLPFSESRILSMTSADAEAANLLLTFSHSNRKQPQITPKHKTMPALIPIMPRPEMTFQNQIEPELKTTGQNRDDIAQGQKLPVMDPLDWLKMMINQRQLLPQPQTVEEKVELVISEACKMVNIGANSQTLQCLSDEFDKLIDRLKTKGFNLNNGENYSKEVTNFVIPSSHESATVPTEETKSSESEGFVEDEVIEEHNYEYYNYEHLYRKTPTNDQKIPIGLGYASVPRKILKNINWSSYTKSTRKLLTAVFPRRVLATHCLTGKASPAFRERPAKKQLHQKAVDDIVQTVMDNCGVSERRIRKCITTKCADEAKMLRMRQRKMRRTRETTECKENCPPSTDTEEDNADND